MKELVAGKSSESIFNKALKKRRYNRAFFGEVFAIGAFHMKLIKVREEEYKAKFPRRHVKSCPRGKLIKLNETKKRVQ